MDEAYKKIYREIYITFNKGEIYIPDEIKGRSIGVDGDIAAALEEILKTGEVL